MDKLYEVREFESITCNKDFAGKNQYKYIDEESFSYLEELILTFSNSENNDAIEFLTLTSSRNVGKIIRAKNYVGIVQLKNGKQIQILPKIYNCDTENVKRTFLRMLKCLKNFPSKVFNDTNLRIGRLSIYEVFITLYITEVRNLVKRGVKSAYYPIEDNVNFYKGKLIFNRHLNENIVRKDRFHVSFDEFGINRAENRLIKATLLKLIKVSASLENIKEMRQLLSSFETIESSNNFEKDFSEVVIDRNSRDYAALMRWSKVFLLEKSFTTFSGSSIAKALLFPMDKVFEAYVGKNLTKVLANTDWNVSLQDKGYYLFERQFALRPDIVIEKNNKSRKIILDTKWKNLENSSRSNYGIAQSDMYQMYAYAKKYKTNEIYLLYPLNDEMVNNDKICFESDDGVKVNVFLVDISNIEESLLKLTYLFN